MMNKTFEAYKVGREIKRSGATYEFKRCGMNEFNEPTSDEILIGSILGLYHEQNSRIEVITGDTTSVRTKKSPMILCLYNDVKLINLSKDDFVRLNEKTFKVTGIVNVQEWNVIADISLEVIDNAVQD